MKPIMLVVEKSKGILWGRVHYEGNLLVDTAKTVENLERKFRKLLKDFHGVDPKNVKFECCYDMTAVFENFNYLKITAIADRADMNPALLRQYATGIKNPSAKQAKKVEEAIHKIGLELSKIAIYAPSILFLIAVLRAAILLDSSENNHAVNCWSRHFNWAVTSMS